MPILINSIPLSTFAFSQHLHNKLSQIVKVKEYKNDKNLFVKEKKEILLIGHTASLCLCRAGSIINVDGVVDKQGLDFVKLFVAWRFYISELGI
jgi:hypothetical protein